ncbi:MAG: Hpt domain-containing protein [Lachnospiraceae bacterium]|nr:Hpt domain-containing protein [Lachnospiraceae bacterium]
MDHDITKLIEYGIDTETGIGYTGNREKYISALQRFYRSYDKNRAKVESALGENDLENYMIIVHSLKSNARMIGAANLSAKFEALEMASRNGDMETVKSETSDALSDYEMIVKVLEPIGTADKVTAADEISADEARKIAKDLLASLDDYDDEASALLAAKLAGYPFRLTQKDLLKKATGYIGDFLYDEAAGIIEQIAETIE